MAETKRHLVLFSFYDQQAIVKKLEDMALQGWMIEKLSNLTWKYRKTEPKKLRFAVTYFPKASEFDSGPSEMQLTKEDFCAMDGWTLAGRWGTMQIFYNEDMDAVPVETDPVMQVENIIKSMKKNLFLPYILYGLLMVYQIWFRVGQFFRDPVDGLSEPASLYTFPMWVLLLVVSIMEVGYGLVWCRRAKRAAEEDGVFYPFKSRVKFSYFCTIFTALCLLMTFGGSGGEIAYLLVGFGFTFGVIFLTNIIKNLVKKCNLPRIINQVIIFGSIIIMTTAGMGGLVAAVINGNIIFPGKSRPVGTYEYKGRIEEIYEDELPLEVENLTDTDGKWSKRLWTAKRTLLAAKREYSQSALYTEVSSVPELDYTIIDAKLPAIYEICKDAVMEVDAEDIEIFGISYEALNASDYSVQEIYQKCYDGEPTLQYIICYGERIVKLWMDGDYKEEHLQKAIEILRP